MSEIVKNAKEYILNFLTQNLDSKYVYHNFQHTNYVVLKIKELSKAESISEEDTEIVLLAGWFHDVGYTISKAKHEDHSMEIAKKYLLDNKYDSQKINQVLGCINATKLHEEPTNHLEKIVADADFSHLSDIDYESISENLRLEFEITDCGTYSNLDWVKSNIELFQKHQYYTQHALVNWSSQKIKNLKNLNKKQLKLQKKEQAKSTENKSERSVDTLFRVTLKNHITLSDIADTKANILLSVNAIIISMALSNLLPKFDNPANAFLIFPTIIFVAFSVASMILSVIATRPSVTSGVFSKEDIKNKKVNILFFGNFHKMTLPEFEEGINEVMNDKDYLYSSMSKDLYFLGKVLARKYKILRVTYTVFMIGIICSVVAFAISYKLLCNV